MVITDINPGCAVVGYGVVSVHSSRHYLMEYGAIMTQVGEVFRNRLVLIYDSMYMVLAHNRPDTVSIERLYLTDNEITTTGVVKARGVVLLTVRKVGALTFEYAPLQIKQAVTDYGQAKKPRVIEMTRKLLCPTELPKPDGTTDVLAMAIYRKQTADSPLRRAILPGRIR